MPSPEDQKGPRLRVAVLTAIMVSVTTGAWAAPRQVILSDRLDKGDRYQLSLELKVWGSSRTLEDGVQVESGSSTSIDRERFTDTLLGVTGSGRRSAVRRQYLQALVIRTPAGGKTVTTKRSLQGRTMTVTCVNGQPQVDGTQGLEAGDIEDVQTALRDDAELLVGSGGHSVSDTWPIPQRFFEAFNYQGLGSGTCRLDAIEPTARGEVARISFTAAVGAVDADGRTSNLTLKGHVTWSIPLRRLVSYQFGGPSITTFATRRGATVIRTEAQATVSISARLNWLAVAGRPVRPRQ